MTLLEQWVNEARVYVVSLAATQSLLSVNDIFDAIVKGVLPAPPKPEQGRSGQVMSTVFSGAPYFRRTGQQVAGTNPASKGRKVFLWEYDPAHDDRGVCYTKSRSFFDNIGDW